MGHRTSKGWTGAKWHGPRECVDLTQQHLHPTSQSRTVRSHQKRGGGEEKAGEGRCWRCGRVGHGASVCILSVRGVGEVRDGRQRSEGTEEEGTMQNEHTGSANWEAEKDGERAGGCSEIEDEHDDGSNAIDAERDG